MHEMTRSQYVEQFLKDFFASSEECKDIHLYSKEIRKITRDYGNTVEVEKGEKTRASAEDKRYHCIIRKK